MPCMLHGLLMENRSKQMYTRTAGTTYHSQRVTAGGSFSELPPKISGDSAP